MNDKELQEKIDYIKANCIGNVKALNIDVPVLKALISKVESLTAAMEAVLKAGEEWAYYVEADTAPMQLIKYLERARNFAMEKDKE